MGVEGKGQQCKCIGCVLVGTGVCSKYSRLRGVIKSIKKNIVLLTKRIAVHETSRMFSYCLVSISLSICLTPGIITAYFSFSSEYSSGSKSNKEVIAYRRISIW